MSAEERAFGDFLADLGSERGFQPGLRPRSHASSLVAFEEAPGSDDKELLAGCDEVADADLEGLAKELPYRLEEAEAFLRDGVTELSVIDTEGLQERRVPSEERYHRMRLAAARGHVEACEPRNAAQRDLVGVLTAILTFMRQNLCGPETAEGFERWMKYLEVFWCALEFPELNGHRSRCAFNVLMDLEPEDLFDVARRGHLGHRMPRPKRKKRGRRRGKRRRRRCA